jgi:anti-sigma28 factor (negative regulator of flagellin synthesis)
MQMPSPIGPSHVSKLHGPHGINAPHAPFRGQQASAAAPTQSSGDSLTISAAAEAAIQASETSGVRQDLVNRIRGEIANGTYETSAKLDAAMDRLLDTLG